MNEFQGPGAPPPDSPPPGAPPPGTPPPSWSPPPPGSPPPSWSSPPPGVPPYGQYGQYGPYGQPATPPGSPEAAALVRDLSVPLYRARDWLRLLGVLMIITGALYALTLVGILLAWLPIWMGVLLFKAAGSIEHARQQGEPRALIEGQDKLRTYFTVQGILAIASIVLFGIAMVVISVLGLSMTQLFRNLN